MTVQHSPAGASPPLPREAPPASAHDLTKTYGTGPTAVRALRGVTVVFPLGTFTAVMGPSGSGKSTLVHCLVHCLAGLDRPATGQVRVGGEDLSTLDDRQLTRVRRDRIGFVFQSFTWCRR